MVDLICSLCGEGVESVDHLFLICVWSWKLWSLCMQWWGVSSYSNRSINEWLNAWGDFHHSSKRKRAWKTLFFAIIWTIWEFRNNAVFWDIQANLGVAPDLVRFRVCWWFKNYGCGSEDDLIQLLLDVCDRCIDKENVRVVKRSVWTSPLGNAFFFNVDVSVRGCSGEAGISGALRDASGKILLLFSFYLRVMDSCSAEVHGILKVCQLVTSNMSLVHHHISIISDSKSIVAWINGEDFSHLSVTHLVYDIKNFMQDMAGLHIFFKPRASNSLTDSLTKDESANRGDRLQ
ncbi:hypothetical protein Ddye_022070 [Dipteronia dyeriana]|uniref:RNase H type-1 domain-containing protein n=1 Tax=Dipteronia dyeriana TaxID=168575 RepID=A0AAD9WYL0_9ROSI|nr:hypothetical protein Ddye_022070 [Dipteronia dyeriana]